MYVCMYVCIYVRMYVCTYVCMYVYVHIFNCSVINSVSFFECISSLSSLYVVSSAIRHVSNVYGRGSYHFPYFSQTACSGSENQLLRCSYTPAYYDCNYQYLVGVRCYGMLNV